MSSRPPTPPRDAQLAELRAQARLARERLALYRAKTLGPRETSPVRLRELERESLRAEERLRHALQQPDVPTKEQA